MQVVLLISQHMWRLSKRVSPTKRKPFKSTAQISLLSKGLNFCPNPYESNLGTIRQDFKKFHRSPRRHSVPNTADNFLTSSQDTTDPDTDSSNNQVKPFKYSSFKKCHSGIPPILYPLKLSVVVMNTSDYIKEGLGQLSDSNFLQKTFDPPPIINIR